MADVTGTIGNEPVELNNAATEATLRQLLTTTNTLSRTLLNSPVITGRGGPAGTAANPATTAANQQTQNLANNLQRSNSALLGLASGTLSLFGGALGKVAFGAGALAGMFSNTVVSLFEFGKGLLDGEGKLSDFYKTFESIPIVGIFAGIFGKIAAMQEAETETYKKMTSAGVNFGGQLTQIRQNALQLGFTLEEFSNFIKNNNEALSMMGGSTNDGAEAFVRFSKDLRSSAIGQELRALGFTTEQLNTGLANYISMTGGRNAQEMRDTKALSESAGNYLMQLDMLSQITGKSREQLEEQQKEQAKNAAWQNYLNSLDEKSREKANASMAAALAKGGKGAADALQSRLLGLPPLTKEAQMFEAMAGKARDGLTDYVLAVKDGSKGTRDINLATGKLVVGLGEEGKRFGNQLGGAFIAMGGPIAQFSSLSLNAANELRNRGIDTEEKYADFLEEIARKQQAQAQSTAARAIEVEKGFKDLGAALYASLRPALEVLTPIVNNLATEFTNFIGDNMPMIREGLQIFAKMLDEFVKNILTDEGRKKIVNDLAYYLQLLMIEVKQAILPKIMYDEKDAEKDRNRLKAQKEGYDNIAAAKRMEAENAANFKALEISKMSDEQRANLAKEVQQNKADAEKLEIKKQNEGLTKEETERLNKQRDFLRNNEKALALLSDEKNKFNAAEIEARKKEIDTLRQAGDDKIKEAEKIKNSPAQGPATSAVMAETAGGAVTGRTLQRRVSKREVNIEKAASGGLFSGPSTGYLVKLHGDELVLPKAMLGNPKKEELPTMTTQAALSAADLGLPSNFEDYMKNSSETKTMLAEIQVLNKQTADLLKIMRESAEYTRQNVAATKSLNRNLFAS